MNKNWLSLLVVLFIANVSYADPTDSMSGTNIHLDASSKVDICAEDEIRLATNCDSGTTSVSTIGSDGISLTSESAYVITVDGDPQRKFTFDASSDTALTMKFGDGGTTAAQEFTISGSTSNTDDDSVLNLTGGGSLTNGSGAYIQLYGNQASGFGAVNIITGGDNGSEDITLGATDDTIIRLSLDQNRLITFDAASDTALVMTYGDNGTTASQQFTIQGGGGSNDDDTQLNLAGGSDITAGEGAYITLKGAENTGDATMSASSSNNSGLRFLAPAGTGAFMDFSLAGASKWAIDATGTFTGAGTATIGWTVVDGADDTACSTQCTTPAVMGFEVSGGNIVLLPKSPSATADICLCAGAN